MTRKGTLYISVVHVNFKPRLRAFQQYESREHIKRVKMPINKQRNYRIDRTDGRRVTCTHMSRHKDKQLDVQI